MRTIHLRPLLAALLLLAARPGLAQERTRRSVSVVTQPDGTRTTTTVVTTTGPDGRTTVSRTTTTQGPGDAGPAPAPPEPPTPPQAPPVAPQAPARGGALVSEVLSAHNRERQRAGAPPLGWDEGLARLAQEWSAHLCRGGQGPRGLQHRPVRAGGPGENLWQGAATGAARFPVSDAVRDWAAERRYYDARSGRCLGGVCGHYTQLIWRGTTHVGCGASTCPSGAMTATVWTCNYAPAGNIIGERP